ncbi:ABC transporter permease [Cutibacterium sp. WCA-380-WT-3A]|uniref:ABC transporter permease n=1 Tax=Cutibacterium porci TaxID=2605781 RepID=A0A7K0J9S3_9ACTN|nr:TIGR03773 family transporter-associated surface protein [Cutibacterium porci]MSS46498.1 ABC transporter permease [Cutibacterium porci]
MEDTVKRLASLLAALLTFLMINPSSANAAAPGNEPRHDGHVGATGTEPGGPTIHTPKVNHDPTNGNAIGTPDSPNADTSVVLDHGHADVFRVGSAPNGGINLTLKEDVTGDGVLHNPDSVLLKVNDAALTSIPAGLPGAPQGYLLPLTQNEDVLWPGWETFDVRRNGFDSVTISVSNVSGPGKVHLFSQGSFGDVKPLLDSNATELPGTITVAKPSHVHANWVFSKSGVYTMTVRARAQKSGKNFQTEPHTYTWVVGNSTPIPEPWGNPAPTQTPAPSVTSAPPTSLASPTARPVTPSQTSKPSPSPTHARTQNRRHQPDRQPVAKPRTTTTACTKKLILDHGHSDVFRVGSTANHGLNLSLKEDVTGEGVLHAPEDVLLAVKDSALTTIPRGYPGAPKGYLLPITQNQSLLWPGWETFDVKRNGFGEVKVRIHAVKGPGKVHMFSQNSFGAIQPLLDGGSTTMPGTITVKEPSHVHTNWVFTRPGRYEMTVDAIAVRHGTTVSTGTHTYTWLVGAKAIAAASACSTAGIPAHGTARTMPSGSAKPLETSADMGVTTAFDGLGAATSRSGSTVSGGPTGSARTMGSTAKKGICRPVKVKSKATTKTIAQPAGQSASVATEGHFDWGVQLQSGKLISALKDDRSAPATWVDPSSIVMAVGDKAKTTAPAGMEFIAQRGTTVWLIGATQVPGVPWLGVNTMHESVVNGTTGPVHMHLDKVSGPGKMAVFMSGTFGGGVGQRVFDNVGGPTSYTVAANTHAHPNWVFTAPGHYAVTVTQSATTKDGKKVGATGTLHFGVGIAAGSVAASLGKASASDVADQDADPGYTIVGRTPDGKPCDLNSLPRSGAYGESKDAGTASQTSQGLATGVFAVAGLAAALLVARKRRG